MAELAFLMAKGASAATAALAFAAYVDALTTLGLPRVPVAIALVAVLTALVLAGFRRANWLNAVIVAFVLAVLTWLIVIASVFPGEGPALVTIRMGSDAFLHASALLFVAFTGYGRVAWTFSAVSVQICYAVTNLAALRPTLGEMGGACRMSRPRRLRSAGLLALDGVGDGGGLCVAVGIGLHS